MDLAVFCVNAFALREGEERSFLLHGIEDRIHSPFSWINNACFPSTLGFATAKTIVMLVGLEEG